MNTSKLRLVAAAAAVSLLCVPAPSFARDSNSKEASSDFGIGVVTALANIVYMPVKVEDAYCKSVARPIKVTYFVDDTTPAPHPVLDINHGRASDATERAAIGRYRPKEVVGR